MTNLDKYFDTEDELFNRHSYKWYNNLYLFYLDDIYIKHGLDPNNIEAADIEKLPPTIEQGRKEYPNYFQRMVDTLHGLYFFIKGNKNRLFATIEHLNNKAQENNLSEADLLKVIDRVRAIILTMPNREEYTNIFNHLKSYREYILPYNNDPVWSKKASYFLSKVGKYTFEHLRYVLDQLENPVEKVAYIKIIMETLEDEKEAGNLSNEEIGFINDNNFCNRVALELDRLLPQAEQWVNESEGESHRNPIENIPLETSLRRTIESHIGFMAGKNEVGLSIMDSNSHYADLINEILDFVRLKDLQERPKEFRFKYIPKEHIRYAFYSLSEAFAEFEIGKLTWVKFLHATFPQFSGDVNSTYKKFTEAPKNYQKTLQSIKY